MTRLIGHKANRWISVKSRLPKTGGQYLVCNRTGMWTETMHSSWWNVKTSDWKSPEITHWMKLPPLPRLPKKGSA